MYVCACKQAAAAAASTCPVLGRLYYRWRHWQGMASVMWWWQQQISLQTSWGEHYGFPGDIEFVCCRVARRSTTWRRRARRSSCRPPPASACGASRSQVQPLRVYFATIRSAHCAQQLVVRRLWYICTLQIRMPACLRFSSTRSLYLALVRLPSSCSIA